MTVDLAHRLALRPKEAAEALGVSERKLRAMLRDLPHVRVDGAVLIPVDGLRRWLAERAEPAAASGDRAGAAVAATLRDLER